MGCQCNKTNNEENTNEISPTSNYVIDNIKNPNSNYYKENNNNNNNNYDDYNDDNNCKVSINNPQELFKSNKLKSKAIPILPKGNKDQFSERVIELINQARTNPKQFAKIIRDSIKNIKVEEKEGKRKVIYKKTVKVALNKGQEAFEEAADYLDIIEPIQPLQCKNELKIPLPDNESQIQDSSFIKEQVSNIKLKHTINIFFKDLIKDPETSVMLLLVDDSGKDNKPKRNAVLNPDFKYIGVNAKFINKKFVAYFAFANE